MQGGAPGPGQGFHSLALRPMYSLTMKKKSQSVPIEQLIKKSCDLNKRKRDNRKARVQAKRQQEHDDDKAMTSFTTTTTKPAENDKQFRAVNEACGDESKVEKCKSIGDASRAFDRPVEETVASRSGAYRSDAGPGAPVD